MTGVPTPLGFIASLFGFEDFVKQIILSRDTITMFFDIMFERCFDYAVQLLEAGAREVFQISGAELLAPPMFSPRYFEDFVVRYERKIIRLIHDYDSIVYLHCHGRVNAVLDMIADMGVDGLHPVEPPPMGDTPLKKAKRRIEFVLLETSRSETYSTNPKRRLIEMFGKPSSKADQTA